MAEVVLVQGTTTACVWLPRGHHRIVPYTRDVQKLVDRGFIEILARAPVTLGPRKVNDA